MLKVENMIALFSSVTGKEPKVAEYIYMCISIVCKE